ncbi:F510_1955 family glycosylhydrolase [Indiicoccus explosivorum]|uniref:F510_1955 family glycosylhydrolase n=1 Tax=Indiicoccus explosivorum TaxID=1917864 RepID=UPI000B42E03D|nr:hypothetical protein [Indiicoccus explosivorum]
MKKKLLIFLLAVSAAAGCSETDGQSAAGKPAEKAETAEMADSAVAFADTKKEKQIPAVETPITEESGFKFTHIHGLGIAAEDEAVYVPSHRGLKIFRNGRWSKGAGAPHDYMGFSMVDDGFYSSGHPAAETELADPFGIVRSTDHGESLALLDLFGEVDIHLMAAGYHSHTLYVVNPQPNTRMDYAGVFYSEDDSATWTQSQAEGLAGRLTSIAAHPEDGGVVAIGTDKGLFLSENFGKSFETVSDMPTTAVAFTADGRLLAASTEKDPIIMSYHPDSGKQVILHIPKPDSASKITYLAADDERLFFATSAKNIFMTEDAGASWMQIADRGIALNIR